MPSKKQDILTRNKTEKHVDRYRLFMRIKDDLLSTLRALYSSNIFWIASGVLVASVFIFHITLYY